MQRYILCLLYLLIVACSPKIDTSRMDILFLEKDQNWQIDRPIQVNTELDVIQVKRSIQQAKTSTHWRAIGAQGSNYSWYTEEVFKILGQGKIVNVINGQDLLIADLPAHKLSIQRVSKQQNKSSINVLQELKLPVGKISEFSVFSYNDGYLLLGNRNDRQLYMFTLASTVQGEYVLKLLWQQTLTDLIANAPALSDQAVFCQTRSNKLYKLNHRTGNIEWIRFEESYNIETKHNISPLLVADKVIVLFNSGNAMAFSQDSGKLAWQTHFGIGYRIDSPLQILHNASFAVTEGEILYLAGAYKGIFAINLNNGRFLWQTKITANSPLILQQHNLCFLNATELLICLDKQTGIINYQESAIQNGYPTKQQ